MKTISFYLRFLTYVLIFGCILFIVTRVFSVFEFPNFRVSSILGESLPTSLSYSLYCIIISICCLSMFYLIYHLNIFRKVITDFYNDLVFSDKNGRQLYSIGCGLIIFTIVIGLLKLILGICFYESIISEISSSENALPYNAGYIFGRNLAKTLFLTIPILCISLIFLLLSELIKKGLVIQSENDLTI